MPERPLDAVVGRRAVGVRRLGKRVALDFSSGTLVMTEASSRKRASLHVVRGEDALHCAPWIPAASRCSRRISRRFAPS
jgi:hypothetical protein